MSVCLSVCLSVWPSAWNNSAPTKRLLEIWHLRIFWKSIEKKIKLHYNLTRMTGTLHDDPCKFKFKLKFFGQFFLEWEIFQTKVVDKIKAHILGSILFFKVMPLWDNAEKYGTARQATDGNIARCVLDTWGYKLTLRIRNTYRFSTASGYSNAPQCYVIRTLPVLKYYLPAYV